MNKAVLFASPAASAGHAVAEWISRALGWGYVSLWAVSFVPQIIHSQRRRDMAGVSSDYLWLNVVAFACYFATTVALLESTTVRREYAERHDGFPPIARWNDAVFAVWAWLCALVQLGQAWMFRSTANRVSRPTLAMLIVMVVTLALGALVPAVFGEGAWAWLAFVDYMGILKSYITLIKYVPQVLLNLKRQSTEGYHVANVGSDFLGGILSLLQLFLDAAITGDWSGIVGNPAKLGTGVITLIMDSVLILQWAHYDKVPAPADEPSAPARDEEEATWYDRRDEDPTERTTLLPAAQQS